MKRSITQIILTALIIMSVSAFAEEKYNGGDGTEANPYQINTAEQLQQIGATPDDWGKHFILTNDIDISGYDGLEGRPAFNMIGAFDIGIFHGKFNGQGYSVSGLTFVNLSAPISPVGLFARSDGVIENLVLDNTYIEVGITYSVAGLVGINGGIITNCHVEGEIGSEHHNSYAGLLVGQNRGTVENCTTQGFLFGAYAGGLIGKNLAYQGEGISVKNCSSTADVTGMLYAGGLIGENEEGSVSLCFATGSVLAGVNAGGLIGDNNSGSISSCFATGLVSGYASAGGLIGDSYYYHSNIAYITNCYASGDVSADSEHYQCAIGGLAGRAVGHFVNCYASGKLTGHAGTSKGGLVGLDLLYVNFELVFENCFWDAETSGVSEVLFGESYIGAVGLGTEAMQTQVTYDSVGWDFVVETNNGEEDIWAMCDGVMTPIFARDVEGDVCDGYFHPEGSGTSEDPYQISTVEELLHIGEDSQLWDKHFVLADNIDLNAYNDENNWPNFNSIGTFENPFTGVFDGNGYSVTGLFWSSEEIDDVGMFGWIGEEGVVRGLIIDDAGIDATGGINVGIVAGINEGTIENCTVTGMVIGNYATGGIVGLNLDYATISGCDSSGEVFGTFSSTGGIAGDNYGRIEKSSSKAFVEGQSRVGSIVGYNAWGVIENCYSHASPEGSTEVGGLVGRNFEGEMTNCYSTRMPVSDDGKAGALVGTDIGPGVYIACFYNTDMKIQLLGIGSADSDPAGIIGETTANLKLASTYAGWDTTTPIWVIRDNFGYPRFKWQIAQCDIAGSWGVNLADLQVLASNWLKTGFTSENANENGDFDASGTVDLADFAILSSAFQPKEQELEWTCDLALNNLMDALDIYAFQNNDHFPLEMSNLLDLQAPLPHYFSCPATNDFYPEMSYAYRGAGLGVFSPPYMIVFYDKAGNHDGGRNVVFVDKHVEWMTEIELQVAIGNDNIWRTSELDLEEISIE